MVSKMVDLSDDRWNKLNLFIRSRIINLNPLCDEFTLLDYCSKNQEIKELGDMILLMIARGIKKPTMRSRYYKNIKLIVEEINLHLRTSGTKAYFERFGFDTTLKIHGWWN